MKKCLPSLPDTWPRRLTGSTPATIDPMRSMKDYGANSLDIVEVVSGAMRELKVKVPRTELNKLTNVDGLVGLLHEIKSGGSQVAP